MTYHETLENSDFIALHGSPVALTANSQIYKKQPHKQSCCLIDTLSRAHNDPCGLACTRYVVVVYMQRALGMFDDDAVRQRYEPFVSTPHIYLRSGDDDEVNRCVDYIYIYIYDRRAVSVSRT